MINQWEKIFDGCAEAHSRIIADKARHDLRKGQGQVIQSREQESTPNENWNPNPTRRGIGARRGTEAEAPSCIGPSLKSKQPHPIRQQRVGGKTGKAGSHGFVQRLVDWDGDGEMGR